jgi:hypothetical protein
MANVWSNYGSPNHASKKNSIYYIEFFSFLIRLYLYLKIMILIIYVVKYEIPQHFMHWEVRLSLRLFISKKK